MPICTSCGQQFDEGVRFCPACGSPAQQAQANADQGAYQQNYQQQNYQQPVYQQPPYQQAGAAYAGDKTMAILAVVFPILFFLPLVAGNKDEFGKFWANQALLLFLPASSPASPRPSSSASSSASRSSCSGSSL